jgi:hypothetical protein
MLKGKRTYLTILAIVITGALGVIESSGVAILTPEITAGVVTLLGAFAVYFRSKA